MTLSDSTTAFDCKMNDAEFDATIDEDGFYVVEYDFSCQHIGNVA
jgi:hypothetical protein